MSCGGTRGKIEPDISNTSQSVEWFTKNINSLVGEVFIVLCLVSVLNNKVFEKKTDTATAYTALAW